MKNYSADPADHDAVAAALLEKLHDQNAKAPAEVLEAVRFAEGMARREWLNMNAKYGDYGEERFPELKELRERSERFKVALDLVGGAK